MFRHFFLSQNVWRCKLFCVFLQTWILVVKQLMFFGHCRLAHMRVIKKIPADMKMPKQLFYI